MGIKQIITDDLTGVEIPSDSKPTTVRMDGEDYEVYLSTESKETMVALLNGEAPLLQARTAPPTRQRAVKAGSTGDNGKIRAWAQSSGFVYRGTDGKDRTLGDRGAIPEAVVIAAKSAGVVA